ncbi:MAG: TRAP transporter large permease subunit [Rhodobacteraceae bacterium]|nr:TRAP transporter large permease subunit [Paracoccaceae bacterium]
MFGLDGIEIGLIIVFACLFAGIMSGFPVAFAIGGAALIGFGILAVLDSAGLMNHQVIDHGSQAYKDLRAAGVSTFDISLFRYPDLPTQTAPLFEGGWERAVDRNLSFIVNRMNERVIAGQSIETLLAVLMFVMMGIALERSGIASELLTTMSRVFGPLPGGLAVSVVAVGAFLAASTGIVGATVVTMGLLSLPTMLRHNYSPELASGVITASGTLGQIIPPSIVIVLLGTLAGDLYATAQEERAQAVGCSDALTYLGEAAVVSVGTLFQAAIVPGIMLALLYGAYAFGYALLNPSKAPPVPSLHLESKEKLSARHMVLWLVVVPAAVIAFAVSSGAFRLSGSQDITVSSVVETHIQSTLRTNVSDECKEAMIALHGQEAWDEAIAGQHVLTKEEIESVGAQRTAEEIEELRQQKIENAAPVGTGVMVLLIVLSLVLVLSRGVAKLDPRVYIPGIAGIVLALLADIFLVSADSSSGRRVLFLAIPFALILYSCRPAAAALARHQVVRVLFPPLVLIVAVLGSILAGISNPTPAAAFGAAGAIFLAAYRKLEENNRSGKIILASAFSVVIMLLVGVNFDLRTEIAHVGFENWVALLVALVAYHIAFGGLLYSCWVLYRYSVLSPIVRETAKVVSMVFTILIGSQLLNLVIISFGGEHYIQEFLRSFDREWVVFLIVMLVLFILGFVLDFLEIIYIVIPIVGPVIYGGTLDPKWVTIMIAVNLQTSFLTPPFGFALFYLRGVAPKEVTTRHIYRGVVPFVIIQVVGLAILWAVPGIVEIVPDLLAH